ncbi:putative geranylgeranyl transferase type-2 subunit alpha [Paratrimastix pyriformis]|uniref:Geranylgeranyl transferase type-2 subunit alpha n=1 Tax=Paratrimastix pyriformis TaxID=342808 RepID=A0ABQ8UWR1_9EUKA|nr:putative geranylgeranyl transferase type-2 subunit alpha [Paratrimastix pyriformis]
MLPRHKEKRKEKSGAETKKAEELFRSYEPAHRTLLRSKSQDFSLESLDLTSTVLSKNPEFHSAWNYRRDILLHLRDRSDFVNFLEKDLDLTVAAIKINPKVYATWDFRRWLLGLLVPLVPEPRVLWEKELKLCALFNEKDNRNFHCWNHRRWAAALAQRADADEFGYTTAMIAKDPDNYSSLHNRFALLSRLCSGLDPLAREIAISQELAWFRNLVHVAYKSESLWRYLLLLLHIERKRPFAAPSLPPVTSTLSHPPPSPTTAIITGNIHNHLPPGHIHHDSSGHIRHQLHPGNIHHPTVTQGISTMTTLVSVINFTTVTSTVTQEMSTMTPLVTSPIQLHPGTIHLGIFTMTTLVTSTIQLHPGTIHDQLHHGPLSVLSRLPGRDPRGDLTELRRIDPKRTALYRALEARAAVPASAPLPTPRSHPRPHLSPTGNPTQSLATPACLTDEPLLARILGHLSTTGNPVLATVLALVCRQWAGVVSQVWTCLDLTRACSNPGSVEFLLGAMLPALTRLVVPLAPDMASGDALLGCVARCCPLLEDLTIVGDAGWRHGCLGTERSPVPCARETMAEVLAGCPALQRVRFVSMHCGQAGGGLAPVEWFGVFDGVGCAAMKELEFVDCRGFVGDEALVLLRQQLPTVLLSATTTPATTTTTPPLIVRLCDPADSTASLADQLERLRASRPAALSIVGPATPATTAEPSCPSLPSIPLPTVHGLTLSGLGPCPPRFYMALSTAFPALEQLTLLQMSGLGDAHLATISLAFPALRTLVLHLPPDATPSTPTTAPACPGGWPGRAGTPDEVTAGGLSVLALHPTLEEAVLVGGRSGGLAGAVQTVPFQLSLRLCAGGDAE